MVDDFVLSYAETEGLRSIGMYVTFALIAIADKRLSTSMRLGL
jgi:hypothetical protein